MKNKDDNAKKVNEFLQVFSTKFPSRLSKSFFIASMLCLFCPGIIIFRILARNYI